MKNVIIINEMHEKYLYMNCDYKSELLLHR